MDVRSTYSKIKVIKKKKKNPKVFVWAILILIFLFGIASAFLMPPFWKIKKIEASGTEKIPAEELINSAEELISGFFLWKIPKSNYFLVSGGKLIDELGKKFPGIKEIKVSKKFPPALTIKAQDRQKAMIYCGKTDCFYLDDDGIIFEEAPEIYGGLKAVLKDESGREIKKSEKAIDPKLIDFIVQAQKIINEEVNISLVNFEISKYPVADLIAITPEEWKIMFDTKLDLVGQVASLKKVLEEKIKDQRSMLEYIDLRIGNRVYYKIRN